MRSLFHRASRGESRFANTSPKGIRRTAALYGFAVAMFGSALGCGSSEPIEAPQVDDLIGGGSARGVPAVGAILDEAHDPYCTGTLIAPRAVITAKHCVDRQTPAFFAVGSNAFRPTRTIPVRGVEMAGPDEGGFIGFGLDVAILRLAESADPIVPLALGAPLARSDEGSKFTTVGYGIDEKQAYGKKKKGSLEVVATRGAPLKALFGTFEEFLDKLRQATGYAFSSDTDISKVRALFLAELFDGHEVYALGDGVQNCTRDSGGPLLRARGDKFEIVGIASGVGWGDGRGVCVLGTAFVTPGPKVQAFVSALASCDFLGPSGACTSTGIERCTGGRTAEGPCPSGTSCMLVPTATCIERP